MVKDAAACTCCTSPWPAHAKGLLGMKEMEKKIETTTIMGYILLVLGLRV